MIKIRIRSRDSLLKEVRYSDAEATLLSASYLEKLRDLLLRNIKYNKYIEEDRYYMDIIYKAMKNYYTESPYIAKGAGEYDDKGRWKYKQDPALKITDTLTQDDLMNSIIYYFAIGVKRLITDIINHIDTNEKNKAQALLWLKKLVIKREGKYDFYIGGRALGSFYIKQIYDSFQMFYGNQDQKKNRRKYQIKDFESQLRYVVQFFSYDKLQDSSEITSNLELFFKLSEGDQGIPVFIKDDLNNIYSVQELRSVVNDAKRKYNMWYRRNKLKEPNAGIEEIIDDPEWKVYITHTKEANCNLAVLPNGESASWCTADLDRNWFDKHYRKDSPLFVFVSKKDPNWRAEFSYSAREFKDIHNEPLPDNVREELHNLLLKYGIDKKYPIISAAMKK